MRLLRKAGEISDSFTLASLCGDLSQYSCGDHYEEGPRGVSVVERSASP
jgi:hypothetical protein